MVFQNSIPHGGKAKLKVKCDIDMAGVSVSGIYHMVSTNHDLTHFKHGCADMTFLPHTDIRYIYNLKLDSRYQSQYPIFDLPHFETTFEVKKQKLKLKDVVHIQLLLVCYRPTLTSINHCNLTFTSTLQHTGMEVFDESRQGGINCTISDIRYLRNT